MEKNTKAGILLGLVLSVGVAADGMRRYMKTSSVEESIRCTQRKAEDKNNQNLDAAIDANDSNKESSAIDEKLALLKQERAVLDPLDDELSKDFNEVLIGAAGLTVIQVVTAAGICMIRKKLAVLAVAT